jgi:glycosyltransferase involved in cell wall biosynthesis
MPRVSIGLPVYNGERYIAESVRSVLEQSFDDFELIVSDNASTDATVDIVERVADGDPRVTIVRNEVNRGAAWNYNHVFDLASGELFRWHAHDDLLAPGLIERLVRELDADDAAVLAHSWTRFIDADGDPLEVFRDDLHVTSLHPADRLREVVRRLTFCNAVFGLVRSDVLARTARIGEFPGSDVPLLYELAVLGRFAVVPEELFLRRPGNSLKANRSNRAIAAWFGPSARGARLPSFWLWLGSVRAIARSPYPVVERIWIALVFHRYWPIEYLRRLRRRARRRSAS